MSKEKVFDYTLSAIVVLTMFAISAVGIVLRAQQIAALMQ